MNNKYLVMILLVLTVCVNGYAQQQPHYTQYIMNTFIVNPAVAGIENYWDVRASHRHQWAGLNGSPVTTYLTVHGPLRKSDFPHSSPTGFDPQGENPRGKAYWKDYEAPEPHAGVGLTVLNDRTGPLSRFSVAGTYAHHIGIAPRTALSGGVSLGVQSISLDARKLNLQDPNDPAIGGFGQLNRWRPDISAGLWLYSADYFVGVSAQNIVPFDIKFDNDRITADSVKRGKLMPHLFFTTGYRLWLNEDVTVLPSVMVRYLASAPVSFDVNAKVQYRDRVWAGASYRINDGFAGMLGVNINSTFNIGYSYDYTASSLNAVSRGTHEIMIGLMLGNGYRDLCPRNVW